MSDRWDVNLTKVQENIGLILADKRDLNRLSPFLVFYHQHHINSKYGQNSLLLLSPHISGDF